MTDRVILFLIIWKAWTCITRVDHLTMCFRKMIEENIAIFLPQTTPGIFANVR